MIFYPCVFIWFNPSFYYEIKLSLCVLFLSQVGEISEIRLVKNFKGQSKGYAYVEFIDEVLLISYLGSVIYSQHIVSHIIKYLKKYHLSNYDIKFLRSILTVSQYQNV